MKRVLIFAAIPCFLLSSCSTSTPSEVTPDVVSNNDKGILCYKGVPYTGKVISENNAYMLVEKGAITHLVMTHSDGSIAIKMDVINQSMIFKDKQGNYLTKEEFLSKYPIFKDATSHWNGVKLK